MSKALEALRALDEAITNKLTQLCWWTDIHYGKDSLWYSKTSFSFLVTLANVILVWKKIQITVTTNNETFFLTVYSLFLPFLFLFVYFIYGKIWIFSSQKIPLFRRVVVNAKNSPNKNKNNIETNVFKIAMIVLMIIGPVFFGESGAYYPISYFSVVLSIYFLCTEPIPPAVKRKKLEEREIKRLQCIPQKN